MARGYTSNQRLFEKRGNPWVSQKEGIKDFNRNPETEDPEYDFDHRFHNAGNVIGKPVVAPERVEYHDPRPAKGDDPARRKASIAIRLNQRINSREKTVAIDATARPFKICQGCRSARCIAKGLCFNPLR